MTIIQKITRLDHPGVLRDASWPSGLPTFGRFNLIYGWNGSGKTTLSRLFRHLEHRTTPSPGQVTLGVDGREIDGDEFPQTAVQVRVFNRDFVDDSVFPVDGGDVPPIFVIGRESVKKQKKLDQIRAAKTAAERRLRRACVDRDHANAALDKHCIRHARVIKDTLRISGTGAYNNYNKTAYRNRVTKMTHAGDASLHHLDDATRDRLLLRHRETTKPKVPEVPYRLPSPAVLRDEVAAVMFTTISSTALRALKDDPELADWTHHGLKLHKDRGSQACLFCEQTLLPSRLPALEAHFSAAHTRFLERLDRLRARLKAQVTEARELRLASAAEFYDDIATDYDSARLILEETLKRFARFVGHLIGCVEEKSRRPFTQLQMDVKVPETDGDVVDRINIIIREHNKACDDFQDRTATARQRLADGMVAESSDEYRHLERTVHEVEAAIDPMRDKIQRLSHEMTLLEQAIVEHRQPAAELNNDLANYLGHDELRLDVKDTGYALVRRGVLADSLSEGERTALALLYFLKSLNDRRFDVNQGVVMLDDPVSSLDANALYLAFGYIRHRMGDVGQLFVFTHNFAFFRQVRNWFHHLPGQRKKDVSQRPARFYMLERVVDAVPRRTELKRLDPLLERYESEYHYLFACVYRGANATHARLEDAYALPNIARRLLEMFLAFRQPQIAGELWKKLNDIEFDGAKKTRMIRFVHTHSHSDVIGEPEHDPSVLGEAHSVLADVMHFMESQDPGHFKAMVEVVRFGNGADDGE